MTSSNSHTSSSSIFVVDASVVINLNATRRAATIIQAFPARWIVTSNAHEELRLGAIKGHHDFAGLEALIGAGLIELASLGRDSLPVYESLISGNASDTLDDGEAATLALAHKLSAAAVIDERKARIIADRRFPSLEMASTATLLTDATILTTLGVENVQAALISALREARMRVPPELVERVVAIIGEDEAALCSSLPRSARRRRSLRAAQTS